MFTQGPEVREHDKRIPRVNSRSYRLTLVIKNHSPNQNANIKNPCVTLSLYHLSQARVIYFVQILYRAFVCGVSNYVLKALDTFGISQDQYSRLVYPNICNKITNLWKCWLNWSSNLRENNEGEKTLLHYFVCFQMHNKKASAEVLYYLSEKLPFSQKLRYFRGNRVLQCFILSKVHRRTPKCSPSPKCRLVHLGAAHSIPSKCDL